MIAGNRHWLLATVVLLAVAIHGCAKVESEGDATQADSHDVVVETNVFEGVPERPAYEDDGSGAIVPASYSQYADDPFAATLHALKPLQVLIGEWKGVTVRAIGGAKAVESPRWNWDFLSDGLRPALVVTSRSSPYLKQGRLTYLTDRRRYQLKVTSANGSERLFEGAWVEPPQDASSAAGVSPPTFKLKLNEMGKTTRTGDVFILNVQGNDHYVLEVHRQSGVYLENLDAVDMVRRGPSVGNDPAMAAQHACPVSGGTGTIAVDYNGSTYHLCCEGCKEAFLANPKKWIAAK